MAKPKLAAYTEASIHVADYPENVRRNPGMYFGSADKDGISHILKEIRDNSVDELVAVGGGTCYIRFKDGVFLVADDGRGIPVKTHAKTKESTLITVLTRLHAGGKMQGSSAYATSVGVHGVGAAVTNAVSEYMIAWVFREKKWHEVTFKGGKTQGKVRTGKVPKGFKKGTVIEFKPDPKIFGKAKPDLKAIRATIENLAYFTPTVKYILEFDGKPVTIQQEEGLAGFVKLHRKKLKADRVGKMFEVSTPHINCALQWSTFDDDGLRTYASSSYTSGGGTHARAFETVLSDVIGKYAKAKQTYKKANLRIGLIGALNVNIASPKFNGQSKERLASPEAEEIVLGELKKPLEKFFAKHKQLARDIIERACALHAAEQEFKISKAAASKIKGKRGKTNLPTKLATANSAKPGDRELFLVEGDGAGGTAKDARDKKFQEVLPLKGKVLNVFKAANEKVFANQSVIHILQSIGYDPDARSKGLDPLAKMRVGKVLLLSDADDDGKHINALLVAMLAKYVPQIFEKKMVYVVNAPLFKVRVGTKQYYGSSHSELKAKLGKQFDRGGHITRMKGWGEANADELWDIAMDPKQRKLIHLPDLSRHDTKTIMRLMGEGVEFRKELLGID